jgi:hypothetical protein
MGRIVLVFGLVLTVWVTIRWIADCKREIRALPVDHDAH